MGEARRKLDSGALDNVRLGLERSQRGRSVPKMGSGGSLNMIVASRRGAGWQSHDHVPTQPSSG